MKKPKKTRFNPHGLTKQMMMVKEAAVDDIENGREFNLTKNTEKYYNVTSKASASSIAKRLWKDNDFRTALIEGLKKKKILGNDSRVENGLNEGLEAYTKRPQMVDRDASGKPIYEYVKEKDFRTRLAYIQEINKIAGVYAPEKKESRRMTLNIDLTEEELNEKIKKLGQELEGE